MAKFFAVNKRTYTEIFLEKSINNDKNSSQIMSKSNL
jgi:hypothetical protein